MKKKRKSVSYAKWGYIFILPFFICFLIFSLIPLIDTVRYSFFEYYRSGIKEIGPNFVGMQNYISLLGSDMLKYAGNTLILWVIGFVPQIVIALLLANWFTDIRLKIKGKQFFKVVIYLPNLIMASAFAMLFFAMFSTNGPINSILMSLGWISEPIDFLGSVIGTRSLVGLMNFLMWFGNTTIMLMAEIMGISQDIFEACELDGCTSVKRFFYITLPLIRPILAYTLITFDHRRPADVRCSADPDERAGKSGPYVHDADHVPEQPSEEQKLRHGGRFVCIPVYRKRYPVLLCIQDDEWKQRRRLWLESVETKT